MRDVCSKCGHENGCSIVQPSDFGGWQDFELHCTNCRNYELVGYVSRQEQIVLFPVEVRRVANMRPVGRA